MEIKNLSFRLCVAVVLLAGVAGAVEVKLDVEDHASAARNAGVVTTGVPFAKGVVKDVSRLSARVVGKVVLAQFLKLAPWPDGSVRWTLMDVLDFFIGGFPETQNPACFARDHNWCRQSAMMLRSGHILQYVKWKSPKKSDG